MFRLFLWSDRLRRLVRLALGCAATASSWDTFVPQKKVRDNKLQNPEPQTLNIEGGQGAVRRGKLGG